MMMNVGFNLGSRDIKTLNAKLGRIYRNPVTSPKNTALIGSTVTLINCLDSSVLTFRLTDSSTGHGGEKDNVCIGSPFGLALLGTKPGSVVKLGLSNEEGHAVVLKVSS
ncbi:GreA/GreB family elongation factor [Marinobacter salexigens]|uniref:GreA/GreB family elongation factor n=1 Tax=Marinobacter salexigens TaxID=1925763 RepID=A0ABS6A3W0_9GAMM|nr:GreA/GreB family elongation factor [Marinobacter salexigens]MBU2872596.1 GreA/GreB family elongation factor [Marinobacter salexigens]